MLRIVLKLYDIVVPIGAAHQVRLRAAAHSPYVLQRPQHSGAIVVSDTCLRKYWRFAGSFFPALQLPFPGFAEPPATVSPSRAQKENGPDVLRAIYNQGSASRSNASAPPLAALLLGLLGGFLLGRLFLCLRFSLGLLRRLLGGLLGRRSGSRACRRCRRRFFRFLLRNHHLFFFRFHDLVGVPAQLLVFPRRHLVVILEIVLLELHSILPGGILSGESRSET